MIDEGDCGMKIGRGNRSTRRKPAPAPLCPPQIPHDQTQAWNPGRCGGKSATNHLSYGATTFVGIFDYIKLGKVSSVLNGSDDGPMIEISCLTDLSRWLPTFSPEDGNISSF
jgi:hypothetical protein